MGLSSGFYICTLMGIAVRVHWSFLAVVLWLLTDGVEPLEMLLLAALFGSVLVHELGHCLAARSVGGQAQQIVLWPLGGLAFIRCNSGNPLHSIWVSLAGPLTHIPMALICAGILYGVGHPLAWTDCNPLAEINFPGSELWHNVVYALFKMQVLLFCFNVLTPAFPMDGGQVLAALLSTVVPLATAALILAALTAAVAVALFQYDLPFLALFLGLHVFRLLAPASDFHPLAGFYARPGVIDGRSPVYVAPGLELKPCQQCGKCIHPGAQQCAYCDARYPFGEGSGDAGVAS